MNHPALLQIQNLSYTYPERKQFGLEQIHFSLEEGKIMAIVGESGSGKTTLLQLIAGLLDPDEGNIWLHEEKVTGPRFNLVPGHPSVKMVFQNFQLSPKINVYQNIAHVLKAYPQAERQPRVRELLKICKLAGLEENMPYELSGGEKQRLAIARALADDPLLLLMDEPFSNMDVILKNQLKEDIIEILQNTGTTAIMVTHDMHDALSVADYIAVMQHGKLIQTGTPRQVYKKPVTPYVAQLFGNCNFLSTKEAQHILPVPGPDLHTICIRAEHIRAEHIHVGHIHQSHRNERVLHGQVTRKHFMGAFTELTVRVEGLLLVVFVKNHDIAENEQIRLLIATDKLIYF